jgi:cytochrome c peroxidase
MIKRLLICAMSFIAFSAVMVDHGLTESTILAQTKSTVDSSAGSHKMLMSWDDIYLSARVFLGRLPSAMPGSESDTPERIALGKKLYFERGISTTKSQSCHDCHLLTEGRAGADAGPTSKGARGTFGTRNSPTVINAGFQAAQFWDGRSKDLIEQAKGPILNPIEMGMKTEEEVEEQLRKDENHLMAFRRAFPGDANPVTYEHLAEAIASFERTLLAPGRFDRLMDGRLDALNAREKRGLTKFIQYGCVECHSGVSVGGRLFKIIGQKNPYPDKEDQGRYDVTKNEEDRQVFKVPMLRNVTRTPPYFHNGQVFTLEEAIAKMGWHQLGLRLTSADISDMIAFLKTLEGTLSPIKEPM